MSLIHLQISQKEFNAFLTQRKQLLPTHEMHRLELFDYISQHPTNTDREVVEHKVYLLNKFSNTRVPRNEMVDHILKIKDFDKHLQDGRLDLVHEIAKIGKTYYSFATKYCAMHQPDKYPIYDKLVWRFMQYLGERNFFENRTLELFNTVKKPKDGYANYVKIYNEFITKSGIRQFYKSYDNVDYYLWGYIQIYIIYHKYTNQAYSIFPDIFKGVISCALWEIIKYIFITL